MKNIILFLFGIFAIQSATIAQIDEDNYNDLSNFDLFHFVPDYWPTIDFWNAHTIDKCGYKNSQTDFFNPANNCGTYGWHSSTTIGKSPNGEDEAGWGRAINMDCFKSVEGIGDCEGIYKDVYIKKGYTYKIKVKLRIPEVPGYGDIYKFAHGPVDLYIKLVNNLPINIGVPRIKEVVFDSPGMMVIQKNNFSTQNNWLELESSFTADKDYSQLSFYAIPAKEASNNEAQLWIGGGEVYLESTNKVCPNDLIYTSNYIPLNGNLNLYPDLNKAINSIQVGNGDFVIKSSFTPTIYNAGKYISMNPGFEVKNGSNFTAEIKECSNPLTVSIKTKTKRCGLILYPRIEGGSGNYEYTWSDGSKAEKLEIINQGQYSLTIKDKLTNQIVSSSIDANSNVFYYHQEFNGFLPSSMGISPDGDGVNDDWLIAPPLGSSLNRLNVFRIKVELFNRWGDPVINDDFENKENGILTYKKDMMSMSLPPSVYFYKVTIYNCKYPNGKSYTGNLTIMGNGNGRIGNINKDPSSLHPFPNPISEGILNFGKVAESYTLYNSQGVLISQSQNTDGVNVDNLENGIYLIIVDGVTSKISVE